MASPRLTLPFLALAALALTAALRLPPESPAARHQRLEVARLQAHFDSVDAELRQPSAVPLSSAQRAARATLIGWLREYRDAARFPRNDRFPDRAMPYFRDSDGVLCAMAHLIDRSGRGDLVDQVASTRNNASIAELAGDPELIGWLDSVGLTVAEAARVQPFYGSPPGELEEDGVSTSYALTSMLASGVSLATVGVNAIAPSRASGWAGLLAGGAALVTGLVRVDREGATGDVAVANIVAGAGAAGFGLYRLVARPAALGRRVAVGPLVAADGDGLRYGLAVRSTF